MDVPQVLDFLHAKGQDHNYVFVGKLSFLKYISSDLQSRFPVFGFELGSLILDDLSKIGGLTLFPLGGDFRFEEGFIGIVSVEEKEDAIRALSGVHELATTNPFSSDRFYAAEKFRESCKDRYKLDHANELPSLRHELVQFYQARGFFSEDDGSTPRGPYAEQVFLADSPVEVSRDFNAYRMLTKYLGSQRSRENLLGREQNFGIPSDFDVVKELGLEDLLREKVFRPR